MLFPTTCSLVFQACFHVTPFRGRQNGTPFPKPSLAKQQLRKYIPSMEHLDPVASGSVRFLLMLVVHRYHTVDGRNPAPPEMYETL